jgi:hypothetical protein
MAPEMAMKINPKDRKPPIINSLASMLIDKALILNAFNFKYS